MAKYLREDLPRSLINVWETASHLHEVLQSLLSDGGDEEVKEANERTEFLSLLMDVEWALETFAEELMIDLFE